MTAAALGDVVFLHQRVLSMEGNSMEVHIKGRSVLQPQIRHGIKPQTHEPGIAFWIDASAVLREVGTFGRGVEAGE